MKKQRCAIFSCQGLGDGLITLTLSYNLHKAGYETTTYHPFLSGMQAWFPDLPLKSFPYLQTPEEEFKDFDRFFIFFEKSPWMNMIIQYCQKFHPDKTTIINPIATLKKDYPYWENAKFDGAIPFVDNLQTFCKEILHLKDATKENGITPPKHYQHRKNLRRVILHPTSSRPGKNWDQEKFLSLSRGLQRLGFEPYFILTHKEREGWPESTPFAPEFKNLSELAGFVYEAAYMIGNDSGIGHLASSLGLPTLTICRSPMTSLFWKPAWSPSVVVCPPSWIPNVKGLRLRDKHWKKWIPVTKVRTEFKKLVQSH